MGKIPQFNSLGFDDNYKPKEKEKYSIHSTEAARTAFSSIHPRLKYDLINSYFNMGELLNNMGIETRGSNIFCPFHPDTLTGKPSAKYFPDSDTIHCFSESRTYTAYHVLKLLQGKDVKKIFQDIWDNMPTHEKKEWMDKYDVVEEDVEDKEWGRYSLVTSQFREGNVDFEKHKKGLFKVIKAIFLERGGTMCEYSYMVSDD